MLKSDEDNSKKRVTTNEIYEFLKKCKVYYITTIEGDIPCLRAFGTIDIFDGHLTSY